MSNNITVGRSHRTGDQSRWFRSFESKSFPDDTTEIIITEAMANVAAWIGHMDILFMPLEPFVSEELVNA